MCKLFCDKVCFHVTGWGSYVSMPLKFQTNKMILKLEIVKVVEVDDWNELIEFNGFQFHYSQAESVRNKENIADDHGSRVEQHIKEKVEAARDWLEDAIHSWKGRLGFSHYRYEKKTED